MKKNFFGITALTIGFLVFGAPASAQNAKYVPERGHWQLIDNSKQKKPVTVQFYSDGNELIYEEVINKAMNPEKKKVRKQLYNALKEAYGVWMVTRKTVNGSNLIAKRL